MREKFIFAILLIIVSTTFSFSQEKREETTVSVSDGNACESNSAYFDMISTEVNHTKQNIFAIFRAGKNETEIVNAKRLFHVKMFLEKRKGWSKFNVVYARGEKTNNEGKIEFYIGGELFLILNSSKNKTPCLDCCNGGFELPQNLDKVQKRHKRRKIKNSL